MRKHKKNEVEKFREVQVVSVSTLRISFKNNNKTKDFDEQITVE